MIILSTFLHIKTGRGNTMEEKGPRSGQIPLLGSRHVWLFPRSLGLSSLWVLALQAVSWVGFFSWLESQDKPVSMFCLNLLISLQWSMWSFWNMCLLSFGKWIESILIIQCRYLSPFCLFLFCLLLREKILLCSLGWPKTCYVDGAVCKLTNICLSVPPKSSD